MNQHTMTNPRTQYPVPKIPKQSQPEPGLDAAMTPEADHGLETYEGSGKLRGRKALITGGDSGIGRAVAIAYAREGADVVISHLPDESVDAELVQAFTKKAEGTVTSIAGDLTNELFCKELVEAAVKKLSGLDILVNNAGKQVSVPDIADLSTEQLVETFTVNVFAMFWLTKAAVPHMPEGATIINTTSEQAYTPSPDLVDYAATKAAIASFTKSMAHQLVEKGIRVNAVAPGPVWTPLQPSHGQQQEKLVKFGQSSPMGRPGQPAELAPAYVFLASQESSFITAEIIGVTGGNLVS